jgi:hypothetical protein
MPTSRTWSAAAWRDKDYDMEQYLWYRDLT